VQCLSELKNLSLVAEPARRLLEAVCSLFDTRFNQRDAYDKFLQEHLATSAAAIGPDWPHRMILVSWLRKYHLVSTSFTYAEAFGKCIGTIGAGLNEIRQVIVEHATHEDSEVRCLAAFTLPEGWQADSRTLLLLRDRAVRDKHWQVRGAAVSVIAEHYRSDAQTLPLLRDRAVGDEDGNVRIAAMSAIAEHYRGDEQTLPLLRERALKDESPLPGDPAWAFCVRKIAIEAIAKHWSTHPDTVALLRERAKNDPTPWLRKRAKELEDELAAKPSTSE
jgi:hypothetical protein